MGLKKWKEAVPLLASCAVLLAIGIVFFSLTKTDAALVTDNITPPPVNASTTPATTDSEPEDNTTAANSNTAANANVATNQTVKSLVSTDTTTTAATTSTYTTSVAVVILYRFQRHPIATAILIAAVILLIVALIGKAKSDRIMNQRKKS